VTALTLPDGAAVALTVRRSNRARRILLQIAATGDAVELVLPRHAPLAEGMRFARDKTAWIARRLRDATPPVVFADGVEIPLLGAMIRIRRVGSGRAPVHLAGAELLVAGRCEHVARRVHDWLRARARAEIVPRARDKAARLGQTVARVSLRDTRTRWGSCSAAGNLNFSWRLVLAPEPVLDYVIAHEVAHLVHMHHGPSFWSLVAELCDDVETGRRWLRHHGRELHRYVQRTV
jgi:predicted metal-dependent hydrolase